MFKCFTFVHNEHTTRHGVIMINENFAKRLLNARKQQGLSQDQLVARINGEVKKTAIAKYERGEMMPRHEIIEHLATALNQTIDYFYRPLTVEINKVQFRAKASLGARREDMLRHNIISLTERFLELEQLLGINTTFSNPLSDMIISNGDDMETAANELHKHWDLGFNPLGSVIGILENNGIKVIEIEWDDSFEGYSAYANETYPVIVIRKDATTERKRFTALHELAHLMLEFDPALTDNSIEKLCHHFAGAMLVPKKIFLSEIGTYRTGFSKRELGVLKDKYGISAIALIMRASNLGVLSRNHLIPLLQMVRKDKYEQHIGTNKSTDNATRFDQLLSRALTENHISITKAAELAQMDLDDFIQNYTDND